MPGKSTVLSSAFITGETTMPEERPIDTMRACIDACDNCSTACLQEEDVKMMAQCIALDMDCAQVCRTTAAAIARGSRFEAELRRLCADICTACAAECGKHPMDHCQRCAQACRDCADACRRMVQAA
jgi:hypothetical protein